MRALWQHTRATIALMLLIINLLFFGCAVALTAAAAKLACYPPLVQWMMRLPVTLTALWTTINRWVAFPFSGNTLRVVSTDALHTDHWYLLIANHNSWSDILVLGAGLNHKAPLLKFFMKRALLWQLPIAGWACYLLGYPFVKRHSHQAIKANPALRQDDINTTQAACREFMQSPSTIMNFVEGTRYTAQKAEKQRSPYHHLLKPKTMGVGIVINTLSEQLDGIIDATILYRTPHHGIWDLLLGKTGPIELHYRLIPTASAPLGNYFEDRAYRKALQHWLNTHWEEKDRLIASYQTNT